MACEKENILYEHVLEILLTQGTSGFHEVMENLLNMAMKIERQHHLGAAPYERSEERLGHSNGFKPKELKTALGTLSLQVPQVRDSSFYPSALEKGSRTERALLLSMAEMYVQGVSTRKVTKILEELCGLAVTSSEVSRATKVLDDSFEKWRNRPIGKIRYLYLDASYEKVRDNGCVVDCAVLVATGVNEQGHRLLLGISVLLSEHEVHWRTFLESLVQRGLHGVELITSDAHAGLKAARKAVFPSVPWQRCQFHFQQNAQRFAHKRSDKTKIAATIRAIFQADTLDTADYLVKRTIDAYEKTHPMFSTWLEENIHECSTVFHFPQRYRCKLRPNNMSERINREIKRRTRVVVLFPNVASCERLVTAVLMELSEEWETGKKYIDFEQNE